MKTKREIIEKYGFTEMTPEETVIIPYAFLLIAMDEYAGQTLQAFVDWYNNEYRHDAIYIPSSRIGMFNQQYASQKNARVEKTPEQNDPSNLEFLMF